MKYGLSRGVMALNSKFLLSVFPIYYFKIRRRYKGMNPIKIINQSIPPSKNVHGLTNVLQSHNKNSLCHPLGAFLEDKPFSSDLLGLSPLSSIGTGSSCSWIITAVQGRRHSNVGSKV